MLVQEMLEISGDKLSKIEKKHHGRLTAIAPSYVHQWLYGQQEASLSSWPLAMSITNLQKNANSSAMIKIYLLLTLKETHASFTRVLMLERMKRTRKIKNVDTLILMTLTHSIYAVDVVVEKLTLKTWTLSRCLSSKRNGKSGQLTLVLGALLIKQCSYQVASALSRGKF